MTTSVPKVKKVWDKTKDMRSEELETKIHFIQHKNNEVIQKMHTDNQ
jgi:hypothetical protein